jgi:hypothetical protein
MRARDHTDAIDLAESRAALATAIAQTDRARALDLASGAVEVYRTAGPGYATRLAAVEHWLATQRGPRTRAPARTTGSQTD